MSILELFCSVDDFGQTYAAQQPRQVTPPGKHRRRVGRMHPSEIMTILIAFHQSHYRTFKAYYLDHVAVQWRQEFPTLLSYTVLSNLSLRLSARWPPICRPSLARVPASVLSIQRRCLSVKIPAFPAIKSLLVGQRAAKPPLAGFTALNSIWSSAIMGPCWPTLSHRGMSLIAPPCRSWHNASLASSMAIKAISPSRCLNACGTPMASISSPKCAKIGQMP